MEFLYISLFIYLFLMEKCVTKHEFFDRIVVCRVTLNIDLLLLLLLSGLQVFHYFILKCAQFDFDLHILHGFRP